jgi:undecaprenyl-diphosphatase
MNLQIFLFLNSFAGKIQIVDYLTVFIAEYLGFVLMGALLAYEWIKYKDGKDVLAKQLLLGILGACAVWLLAHIFKGLIDSSRPFLVIDSATQLIKHGYHDSFPSGHTVFFSALGASFFAYRKNVLGIFFIIIAILVGTTRIMAGVHWPVDVLGGLLIGGGSFFILRPILKCVDKSMIK